MENSNVIIIISLIFYFLIDASEIFDAIPPLPDKDLEQERLDVYNYCFSLDIR